MITLITTLLLASTASLLYLQYTSSRTDPSKPAIPPHIRSFIPWLGSGVALSRDPDGFVERAVARHGSIFSFNAAGRKMILVTSPEAIAYVYKHSRTFTFTQIRHHFHRIIFGAPDDMDDEGVQAEMFPAHKRTLQPAAMSLLVPRFTKAFLAQVRELKDGSELDVKGIWDVIFSASAETYFDPKTFPTSQIRAPFVTFDTDFALLAGELPSFMVKKALAARAECISIIQSWFEENASPANVSREELEAKVSMPVAEVIRTSSGLGHDARTTSSLVFAGFWAMAANAPPAAIWCLLLLADHPRALARVRAEYAAALAQSPTDATMDTILADLPLLASDTFAFTTAVIHETLRWSSSNFSMREVNEDTVIPFPSDTAGTLVRKGDRVYCATRPAHMDGDTYEDPEVWDPDRFMIDRAKGGKGSLEFNPWGGGVSICEGRHFAMYELRIIIHAFFQPADLVRTHGELKMDWTRGAGMGVQPPRKGYKAVVRSRGI